jgi:hypothetical protein
MIGGTELQNRSVTVQESPRFVNAHGVARFCETTYSRIYRAIISKSLIPDAWDGERPLFFAARLPDLRAQFNPPT